MKHSSCGHQIRKLEKKILNFKMAINEETLFEQLGGESHGVKTIEQIVGRFYHYMDTLPEVKDIRNQHSPDLTDAKD
jgi:truncated hemoglobin YjbI